MKATVLIYNRVSGYGFLAPEDDSDDLFVHHSELRGLKRLSKGQEVLFDYGEREGKRIARNVRPVTSDNGGAL